MKHNVSTVDSAIRWTLAAVFLAVSLAFNDRPLLTLLAAAAGLVMIGTALLRTCPLYALFGISTCRDAPAPRHG